MAKAKIRMPYPKQKLRLYADENVPAELVEFISEHSFWKGKVSIRTAAECGNAGKDDGHQLAYCRKKNFVLVTLDEDFSDDTRYPFGHGNPGIIVISSSSEDGIFDGLSTLLLFLSGMPLPRNFAGDSKFQVSLEGAVMRGRDSNTREVKTLHLVDGMSAGEIAAHYHYFG